MLIRQCGDHFAVYINSKTLTNGTPYVSYSPNIYSRCGCHGQRKKESRDNSEATVAPREEMGAGSGLNVKGC